MPTTRPTLAERAANRRHQQRLDRSPSALERGDYDGAELRPYQGRPGAMDAYRLPSRMGERLVAPRGVRANSSSSKGAR